MVFLVKGFAQKEEGEAKDAVVVAETLSVAVGELCPDLGFLLRCAGNGVYFVAGGREGAGYLESVFFFKACKEREEGVPPAYAVGFLQAWVEGKSYVDIVDFDNFAYKPGEKAGSVYQSYI